MTNYTNNFLKLALAAFLIWYAARRTNIGREFTTDTATIYQQTGFPEGLKSAYHLISKEK